MSGSLKTGAQEPGNGSRFPMLQDTCNRGRHRLSPRTRGQGAEPEFCRAEDVWLLFPHLGSSDKQMVVYKVFTAVQAALALMLCST